MRSCHHRCPAQDTLSLPQRRGVACHSKRLAWKLLLPPKARPAGCHCASPWSPGGRRQVAHELSTTDSTFAETTLKE